LSGNSYFSTKTSIFLKMEASLIALFCYNKRVVYLMEQIVDGRKIADEIQVDLQQRIKNLKAKNAEAALAVILVGDDKPSHTYVKKKGDVAASLGIGFFKYEYPTNISKEKLIEEIEKIQIQEKLTGMILQLPVPENLWPYTREIVNHINIDIDVDCLSYLALGRVMMNASDECQLIGTANAWGYYAYFKIPRC